MACGSALGGVNKGVPPPPNQMVEGSDHSIKKLMEQKVQQLRVKLEEREKVRRAVAKERKRRYSAKR